MKKFVSVVLILIALITCFSGCSNKKTNVVKLPHSYHNSCIEVDYKRV